MLINSSSQFFEKHEKLPLLIFLNLLERRQCPLPLQTMHQFPLEYHVYKDKQAKLDFILTSNGK